MASKRVLITGSSGLLGRDCLKAFLQDPEWDTLGLAFSRAGGNLKKVDLTDSQQLSETVRDFKPAVILHSAAERRPDIVEKEEEKTAKLNVKSTQLLCDLAKEVGAYVLFISTDYVFDGTSPPYQPSATPNPLNKYGLSKAEGERVVSQASSENVVLRVPILFGVVEKLDESAVTVLFSKVKDASKPAEMNHFERRYPTSCADLAKAIKVLADNRSKNPDLTGFFHWSGTEMMTKYDMAVAMAEVFGLPTSHIVADTKPASGAPRPFDCHLDSSRLEQLGATERTPFRTAVKDALKNCL
ncbi:methionine adenosyltransferase 2 subunit beta isoform X2 [Aplysia californica]|nr:methionine adenosyltransferase 2 subunit beta isoform X2 [Aplysia californica]